MAILFFWFNFVYWLAKVIKIDYKGEWNPSVLSIVMTISFAAMAIGGFGND
jgi:hypothetical protein